jgi:hypothetical protein
MLSFCGHSNTEEVKVTFMKLYIFSPIRILGCNPGSELLWFTGES